jgi:hypothetical protein
MCIEKYPLTLPKEFGDALRKILDVQEDKPFVLPDRTGEYSRVD